MATLVTAISAGAVIGLALTPAVGRALRWPAWGLGGGAASLSGGIVVATAQSPLWTALLLTLTPIFCLAGLLAGAAVGTHLRGSR